MAMLMSCRDGQCRCADIGSSNAKGGKPTCGGAASQLQHQARAPFIQYHHGVGSFVRQLAEQTDHQITVVEREGNLNMTVVMARKGAA